MSDEAKINVIDMIDEIPEGVPPGAIDNDICNLCGQPVGLVSQIEEDTYGAEREFVTYIAVAELIGDGDDKPTLLCEDCLEWLMQFGPALVRLGSPDE